MPTKLLKLNKLCESFTSKRVDLDKAIVYGVKIIGRESPNAHGLDGIKKTVYTSKALVEAKRLYEGVRVNANHLERGTTKDRSVYDRVGKLVNIVAKESGLYGDLHLLKSHPMTKRILEAAQKMPDVFGLSHHASGAGRREGDTLIVESIPSVTSVDIVSDPATTTSLFESKKKGRPMKVEFGAFIEGRTKSLDQAKRAIVRKLLESDDIANAEIAQPSDSMSHEDQLRAGFKGAINAILDDDSLDMKGKMAKIKEIMTAEEKLLGATAEVEEEDDEEYMEGDEEEIKESDEDPEEEDDEEDLKESRAVKKTKLSESKKLLKLAEKEPAVRKLLENQERTRIKIRAKKQMAAAIKLCESMKLPKHARTPLFMQRLAESDAEDRRALVKEQLKLVSVGTAKPKTHDMRESRNVGGGGGGSDLSQTVKFLRTGS